MKIDEHLANMPRKMPQYMPHALLSEISGNHMFFQMLLDVFNDAWTAWTLRLRAAEVLHIVPQPVGAAEL